MPAENEKTELFERTPIPKAVMTLALPTVLSSLVMVLYHLADTFFVGMLDDPLQNAALTLSGPVLLAFNAVNNLFGVGTSSMMSRALGMKDYDTVYRSSAFGFYGSLISGVLFSAAFTAFRGPLLQVMGTQQSTLSATSDYLLWTVTFGAAPAILNVVLAYLVRSEGASLHASIGTMSGCLLNILLDPVFILPWGLNMGAAGAGLATFLSNCAACLYFFVLLFLRRGKTFVCVKPSMFGFRRAIVLGLLGVGVPASIQNLLNVTSRMVLNNFTAAYGPDAVAAMGIASTISSVAMQIAMGGSQGIMPLIGYNYASGNIKRMKETVIFLTAIALGFMAVATGAMFFGARWFTLLFIQNQSVVTFGAAFLRGLCLAQPFLCIDFTAVGVFQSCGMGRRALLFAVLRKIVLEIPALLLLDKLFPPYGLAYSQLVAEALLSAAAVIMLLRIFRTLEKKKSPLAGGGKV
ncbi:MAG: MATE family efflux transporter [Acutalibacter muris]|nr:MATE family efflux transporter [Acutalibacter muris]